MKRKEFEQLLFKWLWLKAAARVESTNLSKSSQMAYMLGLAVGLIISLSMNDSFVRRDLARKLNDDIDGV